MSKTLMEVLLPNPAAVFDRYARASLKARGKKHSASAVARLMGVSPQQWQMWTSGQRSPTNRSMTGWLVKWRGAGYPPVSLVISADGAALLDTEDADG